MNNRHQAFADEYLSNGLNATQAYLSVYPNVKIRTAEVNGNKLLSNAEIKEYLDTKRLETSKSLNISKESLIRDLIAIKDANMKDRPTTSIKAIEIINKMQGYNEPEKTDITTNGENIGDITINVIKPNEE